MNHESSTFQAACAPFIDLIFLSKQLDEMVDDGTENSTFMIMDDQSEVDTWTKYDFAAPWTANAFATIKPGDGKRIVVAISPGGAYWELEPKSLKEAHGKIKQATGSLRALTAIDDQIYACGMGRSVLRREKRGVWKELGPGTQKTDKDNVVGFEDLAGFSADDLYAVGWGGEIWWCNKGTWKQLKSPVTANLNAVCCANGEVFIVGDGVLLRGRKKWKVIKAKAGNLLDVAAFGDDIYAVTDSQILKLRGNTLVAEDAFARKKDRPKTCLQLLAAENGVVALGPKDLLRLDGGKWHRLV